MPETAECCAVGANRITQRLFNFSSGWRRQTTLYARLSCNYSADFPHLDAQLVICSERHGANAKVSTLVQLQRLAKHEVIVISDADVSVPSDLFQQVAARLQQPGVALVNCFYRLTNMSNFPMRWESFAINADFWSQVLQACSLKSMDFAMGAVMVTTKPWLEKTGAFASLADYLADDYQLGNKIAHQRRANRNLSGRRRMPLGDSGLERSVGSSETVGAALSGVPAGPIFLQQIKQCHVLAVPLDSLRSWPQKLSFWRWLPARADERGLVLRTQIDPPLANQLLMVGAR
jgi:hypothetical protein